MIMKLLRKASHILPDKLYIALKYKKNIGKWPNFKNPQTFNEKLQWLKLNDKNPEYIKMVDKHEAKKYVADLIGGEYIIPEYGVWERFEDINFDSLPNQFVLKTTHDCAGVVICRDKKSFDREKAKSFINMHLKKNYFYEGREWPYKNVKPRIIAEKLLNDDASVESALTDYKFYCFNGVPKFMYISKDKAENPTTDFFDMDFNRLDMHMRDPNSEVPPSKPACFEEMIKLAKILSKDINHIRVDFYFSEGKVYVGELTLYHCAGFIPVKPDKWNKIL